MFIINQNSPKNSQIIGKILTKCAKMTDEEYHQQFEQNSVKKSVNGVLVNNTTTINTTSPGSTSKTNENGKHQSPNSNSTSSTSNGQSSSSSSSGTTPPSGASATTNGKNGHGSLSSSSSGGRLQFFKDGKFILELARAKEGEKTSWVSVPRKTFWPPTVSSTNVNFHKHESSTSLSLVSDDNSSIQSSPSFHRDQKAELRIFHTWKQALPRRNVSKEMVLHYHRPRPIKFQLSKESLKELRIKRRRPYDTSNVDLKLSYTVNENEKLPENNDKSAEVNDDMDAIAKKRRRKKRPELATIVQKLTAKVTSNLLMSGGSVVRSIFAASQQQTHVSPRKRILREFEKVSLEETTTMKRSRPKSGAGNTTTTATTTSSLASLSNSNHNPSNSNNNNNNNSNNKLANGLTNEQSRTSNVAPPGGGPPTTPVSRPISSYSIKSLLEHNTSNDNHHHHSNSNVKKESTSHHYDHLKSGGLTSPKSPSDHHMGRYYGGKKRSSPSYSNNNTASPSSSASDYTNYTMIRSPDLSPSPEHQQTGGHSFQRYRQHPYNMPTSVSSPRYSPSPSTNDSTSPYSGKYRTNYLTGSPPATANNNSPQHYSRQSPILNSYNHRKSPLNFNRTLALNESPTHPMSSYSSSRNNNKESSPPMNEVSMSAATPTQTTSSIRTVPKKTAALRQQFGSPVSSPSSSDRDKNRNDYYRDRSNSNTSNASATTLVDHQKSSKKDLDYSNGAAVLSGIDVVDSMSSHLMRPNSMLPTHGVHPAAAAALQYMYPPHLAAAASAQHIPPHLAAYYHQMYSQAMVASAYAARSPMWMHHPSMYPPLHGPPTSLSSSAPASSSPSSGPSMGKLNLNGPSTTPWGLMQPHHLPMDEAVANSVKEEPSSDVPLNLSKH